MKNVKNFFDFIKESSEVEPKEVARGTYDGENIIIYLIRQSPFDNYYYAVGADDGDDWGDVSTKLPGNDLMDAIWVKDGEYEEAFANILVNNNVLVRTDVTTTAGNGMNTYRKYDIV